MYTECDYCPMRESCDFYGMAGAEEQCAEMLRVMIEGDRQEFENAWRAYVSEYED